MTATGVVAEVELSKPACLLLLMESFGASAARAQDRTEPAAKAMVEPTGGSAEKLACKDDDPKAVVVCGPSQQQYRIDPAVLAATRRAEALPPKLPVDATAADHCSGPNCGGGSYVPLVGMALTALKAVKLAADGDDWRDAFRTRPTNIAHIRTTRPKRRGSHASASA
jgi:hypothetical protein